MSPLVDSTSSFMKWPSTACLTIRQFLSLSAIGMVHPSSTVSDSAKQCLLQRCPWFTRKWLKPDSTEDIAWSSRFNNLSRPTKLTIHSFAEHDCVAAFMPVGNLVAADTARADLFDSFRETTQLAPAELSEHFLLGLHQLNNLVGRPIVERFPCAYGIRETERRVHDNHSTARCWIWQGQFLKCPTPQTNAGCEAGAG
jgi:hypothetical protein